MSTARGQRLEPSEHQRIVGAFNQVVAETGRRHGAVSETARRLALPLYQVSAHVGSVRRPHTCSTCAVTS